MGLSLSLTIKRTRKREFLAEMERVVPWAALAALITPYAPQGKRGRPPFAGETMLVDDLTDQLESIKASIRAKVEHPFRVINRHFGHVKVRYRGLAKNTAQLHTLVALSNLWMARGRSMAAQA